MPRPSRKWQCCVERLVLLHNPHAKNPGKRAHDLSSNEQSNYLGLSVTTIMMSYNGPLLSQDEPAIMQFMSRGTYSRWGRICTSLAGLEVDGTSKLQALELFQKHDKARSPSNGQFCPNSGSVTILRIVARDQKPHPTTDTA